MTTERKANERVYTLDRGKVAETAPAEGSAALAVQVALGVPRLQALTYGVPEALREALVPGMRVLVPLGKRRVTGYVIEPPRAVSTRQAAEMGLKDVIAPLEDAPALTEELIGLTGWVADYYCCGWGEAIRAALPGVKERKSVEQVRLTEAGRREAALEAAGLGIPGLEGAGPLRARLLDGLKARPRTIDALAAAGGRGARAEIERLIEEGLIEKKTADQGGSQKVTIRWARLAEAPDPETREKLRKRAPRQLDALEMLEGAHKKCLPLRAIEAAHPGARAACAAMAKKGWIALEDREAPPEADAPGAGEEEAPPIPERLTAAQEATWEAVSADIRAPRFSVTLLHGVTGSGKTEVYIRLAEEALRLGRGALVLVPEIGLTPQLMGRFRARFGERVACLHSAFPERRRAEEWRRVRAGQAPVVLGTRSAVFAPLPNIGLIAVDEEHDPSYKQEDTPRYHARDTAIIRARRAGVPAVLGSATPSMESYARARSGAYRLIELPGRPSGQPLPQVRLVDLRREQGGADAKTPPLLSAALASAIADRLQRGEQTLLFLNRRGFSSVILCRDCGKAVQCEHCDVPLTFHLNAAAGGGRLQCHLCDLHAPPPYKCPACGSERVGYFGLGTERVEEAVRARFPAARVRRMDRDAVRRAGDFDEILGEVRREEVDILIGTQMVAKGHDFPKMTLVGVVLADVGLHLPDFRAGERTFQLLTQVAGRAGRADLPGEVIVQTFRPDHPAVALAERHDYIAFFEYESRLRQAAGYPPYRRLARLRFESKRAEAAAKAGEWVRHFLDRYGARPALRTGGGDPELTYLGPAPAQLARVRGVHRHHLLLKAKTAGRLADALRALDDAFHKQKRFASVQLILDVNPQSLL